MKYCRKCVQADTRPGIYFNEEDICGACLWKEDLEKNIDWDGRQKELMQIVDNAKKKIVPFRRYMRGMCWDQERF